MDKLLQRLRDFIKANPKRAFFNPPASDQQLSELEGTIGRPLPTELRQFLLAFDGGFINTCGGSPDDDYWDLDTERWNSNHFLTVEKITKEFLDWAKIGKDVFGVDPWPYIPFCQTSGQESLVLGPPANTGKTPILDAFHEASPDEWSELYPDFAAFLAAYLDGEGKVKTIG